MVRKTKKILLLKRLSIWILYLLSGFILYTKESNLYSFLINFTRIIYPLSIFWLQIRIKRKSNFLPIDSSMSTSQLWFNILPVLASLLAVIFSITNLFLYLLEILISY